MKPEDRDAAAIMRISRSPYLLAVVDSVLDNLDRESVAELLASYLYLRAKGMVDPGNLMKYVVSKRIWKFIGIAAGAAPAVLAGLIVDSEFRSVVLASVGSVIRGDKREQSRG